MLQQLIVYCIVTGALGYCAWRWMPLRIRVGIASALAALAGRAGLPAVAIARLSKGAAAQAGCGDCGPCKACKAPTGGQSA